MFKEILGESWPVLQKVAPVIASAIGTPAAGSAAIVGMNLLANALGINPANINQIGPAILSHPDSNEVLSSLESRFSEWFKSYVPTLRMPTSLEINIKMTFDPNQPAAASEGLTPPQG